MSRYHHSSPECLQTSPLIRVVHKLVIESAPNQHRELHTQKNIELPSPIVDMPPPQGKSFLIVAFMARESMPPPDNTTDSTAASPTVICRTHSLSPDNTAPPHHPQMPHSSGALSVALRPPNTPTTHCHPLKADRQWRQLLPQMRGRGHHLSLLHLGFGRPTLHLVTITRFLLLQQRQLSIPPPSHCCPNGKGIGG